MSILVTLVEMDHSISRNVLESMAEGPRVLRGIMSMSLSNTIIKGAVPAAVFWYLWFLDQGPDQGKRRSQLVATLATTVVSIAIGRLLANTLPFRPRPLATVEVMGAEVQSSNFLGEWSSMPSDHAVMFFTLACCFLMISRVAGVLLLLHATFIIAASRVLYGLHFLTDVVAGALVGILIAVLVMPALFRVMDRQRHGQGMTWNLPARFGYPLLFLVTFQFATMFEDSRDLLSRMARFLGL